MNDQDWVILDTETTGVFDPIFIIEIAAQRMNGWNPVCLLYTSDAADD